MITATLNKHGNDSLVDTAVEPDSLNAVLWHLFVIFVVRLPVTVGFS